MIVQHNLTAMNSNRMLGLTVNSQAKSTERLSSGYKINRAADDAAGLSISEKMRKQIRGLTQAVANAQDGISAVQTAEGALTEVHDMLQRMNELATKSANGPNSEEDRSYIQAEVDQLIKEIDRVAETTKFNETYLLKGEGTKTIERVTDATFEYATTGTGDIVYKDSTEDGSTTLGIYEGGSATELDVDALIALLEVGPDGEIRLQEGVTLYDEDADTTDLGQQLTAADVQDLIDTHCKVDTGKLMDANGNDIEEADLAKYFEADGHYKGGLYAYDSSDALAEVGAEKLDDYLTVTDMTREEVQVAGDLTLNLHVGADGNHDNKISVDIQSMSAIGIGVNELDISSEETATAAIETLKDSIKIVSEQRSALGAVQNRLEHTINNLNNVVENTTAAEAQIRDTDMATEMVKYANNQILSQAGQAMLAQANQANQGVLSLLN